MTDNAKKVKEAQDRRLKQALHDAAKLAFGGLASLVTSPSKKQENTSKLPTYHTTNGSRVAIFDNETNKIQYLKLGAELFSEEHFDKKQALEMIQKQIQLASSGERKEMAELIYNSVEQLWEHSFEASSDEKLLTKNSRYSLAVDNAQGSIGEKRFTRILRNNAQAEFRQGIAVSYHYGD